MTDLQHTFQSIRKDLFSKISKHVDELIVTKKIYDSDYGIYYVSVDLPSFEPHSAILDATLQLKINLEFNKITKEYNQLKIDFPNENYVYSIVIPDFDYLKMQYDFDDSFYFSDIFSIFLDTNWYKIISHLKFFNTVEDNYTEIAKLLHAFGNKM
jgi:hypothetical protein